MKLLNSNRTAILCIACGAGLTLAGIGILTAVLSNREAVPAALESEYIEETEATHPLKQRLPIQPCSYDLEQLVSQDGVFSYQEDGTVTSSFGIDVSSHQGEIDWTAVQESGVEFVFVRAGYRGYESGKLVQDEYFDQNMQGALDAGLDVGVYFFSQAVTPEEAAEEAALTLSMLEGYDITYPVVYDWEVITNGDYARTANITPMGLTDCVISFCETVKAAGFQPMYYQNKQTALSKMDLELVTDYGFWLAEYDDLPSYPHHFDIWQYTDSGSIPGIEGRVDLNICFTDYTSEVQ